MLCDLFSTLSSAPQIVLLSFPKTMELRGMINLTESLINLLTDTFELLGFPHENQSSQRKILIWIFPSCKFDVHLISEKSSTDFLYTYPKVIFVECFTKRSLETWRSGVTEIKGPLRSEPRMRVPVPFSLH